MFLGEQVQGLVLEITALRARVAELERELVGQVGSVCVRVCACACVRARVRVRVCVCVCVRARVYVSQVS